MERGNFDRCAHFYLKPFSLYADDVPDTAADNRLAIKHRQPMIYLLTF
jgi:hypothetical protein